MKLRMLLALPLVLSLGVSEGANVATGGTWAEVTVTAYSPCTPQGCPPKGRVNVRLSANVTGGSPPSCSVGNRDWVVVDPSEASGAIAAGILQVALISGTTVTVTGTGACSLDPTVETAASVIEEVSKQRR